MATKKNDRRANVVLSTTLMILAIALAGCSGDDSIVAPSSSIGPDTAPPAIPSGLSAAAGSRIVKLAWDPNTLNADLDGFLVYRLAFGNEYLLTPEPIAAALFVDESPLGFPCGYAVSAIDEVGNESAWIEVRYTPETRLPEIEAMP